LLFTHNISLTLEVINRGRIRWLQRQNFISQHLHIPVKSQ